MSDQTTTKRVRDNFGIKFQVAIISLIVSLMAINFYWTYNTEREEILEIATEKAEIIIREYLAAIEFAIRNSSYELDNGKIDVHKNVLGLGEAAKEFSDLLSIFADFKIRMISSQPRNVQNSPDNYEQAALGSFERNPGLKKVYKQIKLNNQYHLRYLVPLRIEKSCLPCHGEPRGKIDITGYEKEGYQLGDIRGAVSLTIPLYTEYRHFFKHFVKLIIFYIFITVIAVIVSYFILKKMVDLNKEINAMNTRLTEQHDTLKEYEIEKSNLIEMIVHDLKNPLTTVRSGIEVVLSSKAIEDKRLNALLRLSHSGVKRLSDMISDILDVSAMESKQFTPKCKTINVRDFMTDVFNGIKLAFVGKVRSLEINVNGEFPPFFVEPNLLKRIIENIVFNAVKHSSPKSAQITTTVDYLDYNDEILISVSDMGEGIPKENLDKVFDKFYQVGEGKHSSLNKGLGLTFCKFAVGIMGGKIWVESEPDKGTTFFFTIKNGYEYGKHDKTQ